jgi:hypothetical protein
VIRSAVNEGEVDEVIDYHSCVVILCKLADIETVRSRTRDRSKGEPELVEKDLRSSGSGDLQPGKNEVLAIFNQSRGKTKNSSLLHLTSTE